MIIVDSREFKSKVVKYLFEEDIDMQSVQLLVGDYLIGENICIERKSVKDFVDSLIDKRIFEQLRNLKSEFKKPILIVEGGEDIYSARMVHANAIRGLIASIALEFQIPIIFSRDQKDTADYLITMLKRESSTPKPLLKINKKILTSDIQDSIVGNLPGVGVKVGKKLLSHFKTIKKMFNASVEELIEVNGVGKKGAEKIFEIANKKYKD